MKTLKHRKQVGFQTNALHKKNEPHPLHYLSQRMSFWIACLSLFTFVVGNMMGQHGWHAFWASVLGDSDDSLIVYTGTVSPLKEVVDYTCWTRYGGDFKVHTFRQSPQTCRLSMPAYRPLVARVSSDIVSMEYMSSYAKTIEGSGDHPGVDYRVPVGTPVRSIANGVVVISEENSGYGKYIVIKHPNAPDPADPKRKTTTIYSAYAHLSAQYVSVGAVVQKGENIALTGDSGKSTGPHLHVQIDLESAPWHPYWPSGSNLSERQELGYLHTINPIFYIQANYGTPTTTIARSDSRREARIADRRRRVNTTPVVAVPDPPTIRPSVVTKTSSIARLQSRREIRMKLRLASRDSRLALVASRSAAPVVVSRSVVATRSQISLPASTGQVSYAEFSHDGSFTGRSWETMRITLYDADGNVVMDPSLSGDLYLKAAYGQAEFRPSILSPLDFVNGIAEVHVLPRGRRTVVVQLQPLQDLSRPMKYER